LRAIRPVRVHAARPRDTPSTGTSSFLFYPCASCSAPCCSASPLSK
jgi:hypothetical protein